MLVCVNVFLYLAACLIVTVPVLFVPQLRITYKKAIVIYVLMVTVFGGIKLVLPINSDAEMFMIFLNNAVLIVYALYISEKGKSRILFTYVLLIANQFASTVICIMLRVDLNADFYTIEFTYTYIINTLGSIFINYLIFYFLQKYRISISFNKIDVMTSIIFVTIIVYVIMSQSYVFGHVSLAEMVENRFSWIAFIGAYIFGEIIVTVLVVKNSMFQVREKIRENKVIMDGERNKYQEILESNARIAKLRHDYVNHLNIIKNINYTEPEKAGKIIDDLLNVYANEIDKINENI